ncbi:MAG: DUF4907 domain-containing protein [Maribacter sp.]|uniref:DUF4907 domain-containing protein n=1 Tax=Maribacter sp. TaxID=1897614 RepID=UPI003C7116E1
MKSIIEGITMILLVIVFTGSLLFGVSKFIPNSEGPKSAMVTKVIYVNDGYGYQILKGNKILIQQEVIPAVAGRRSFRTIKDAQFVADMVLSKISKGDSPVLTVQELNELDIVILAHN